MTTIEIARWFAATRKVPPLQAVALADAVVIRRVFKPVPAQPRAKRAQLTLSLPLSRAGPVVKR